MRFSIHSIVFTTLMMISLGAAPPQPGRSAGAGGQSPGGGASGHFGGTGSDPLRFRHLTMNAVRAKLAADDEQWKSLWPKIEKVLEAQRNARTGAGMSFSSPAMVKGNPPANAMPPQRPPIGGAGAGVVDTPAGRAMQQIRAALENQQTSDEELLKQVTAMRAARDIARAELAAAQKDLHDACSPRQEAVLVTLGVLE